MEEDPPRATRGCWRGMSTFEWVEEKGRAGVAHTQNNLPLILKGFPRCQLVAVKLPVAWRAGVGYDAEG